MKTITALSSADFLRSILNKSEHNRASLNNQKRKKNSTISIDSSGRLVLR